MHIRFTGYLTQINEGIYDHYAQDPVARENHTRISGHVDDLRDENGVVPVDALLHRISKDTLDRHPHLYPEWDAKHLGADGTLYLLGAIAPVYDITFTLSQYATLVSQMSEFFLGCDLHTVRNDESLRELPFYHFLSMSDWGVPTGPEASFRLRNDFLNVESDGTDEEFFDYLRYRGVRPNDRHVLREVYRKLRVGVDMANIMQGGIILKTR